MLTDLEQFVEQAPHSLCLLISQVDIKCVHIVDTETDDYRMKIPSVIYMELHKTF